MNIEDIPSHITIEYILGRCVECPACGKPTQWFTRANKKQPTIDLMVGGKKRKMYVRRLVWRLLHPQGHMPVGRSTIVTSTCTNPMCVDPEQVTSSSRSIAYKRHAKNGTWGGPLASAKSIRSAKKRNKFSDEQILTIINSDEPLDTIAQEYGITTSYVRMLRKGHWRKDVTARGNPFAGLYGK